MDIVSCSGCGIVLDRDKIEFPETWDEDNGCINEHGVWDSRWETFRESSPCPVCKEPILGKPL